MDGRSPTVNRDATLASSSCSDIGAGFDQPVAATWLIFEVKGVSLLAIHSSIWYRLLRWGGWISTMLSKPRSGSGRAIFRYSPEESDGK